MPNNLNDILKNAFENLSIEDNVNLTGKAIKINDDLLIVPFLKSSLIQGAISSDLPFKSNKNSSNDMFEYSEDILPQGGGNVANIKLEPCACLVINHGEIKFLKMEEHSSLLKILEMTKDYLLKKK